MAQQYTDGLIVRCPECRTLNVLLKGYEYGDLRKCLNCEGLINTANQKVIMND